jgi:nucleotide-binding universal stress UspA family protein
MANLSDLLDILRRSGDEILAGARTVASQQGIEAESVVRDSLSGHVADVIVKEAREWPADLIVMETHGRRGLSHLVLGSDAEGVVRSSPVPVLLVKGPAVD